MTDNPNGCAEPIEQGIARHLPPELRDTTRRLFDSLRSDAARARDAHRLAIAELEQERARDKPRTITLAYQPRLEPDDRNADDDFDTGGYWNVYEGGAATPALDPREALALVAAMLLGAPHPKGLNVFRLEGAARRERRHAREARHELEKLHEEREGERREHFRDIANLRELHGSLPWELAQILFGELRRGEKPADGRDVFAVPLRELALRMGVLAADDPRATKDLGDPGPMPSLRELAAEGSSAPPCPIGVTLEPETLERDVVKPADAAPFVLAGRRVSVDFQGELLEPIRTTLFNSVSEAETEAQRVADLYGRTATMEIGIGDIGKFHVVGLPLSPMHFGPYEVRCSFTPSAHLVEQGIRACKASGDELIAATYGSDAEREAQAEAEQLSELELLADMLDAAGCGRSVHELRAWPSDWRVDAQNYGLAIAHWMEHGGDEPPAPWFITGEPEPLESIEARARDEHAGFGLEPPGELDLPGDAPAPAPSVMSQVIAGAELLSFTTPAVPRSAVSAAPQDDDPLF